MSFYTDFAAHYEKIFPFRPATLAFLRRHLPARGRIIDLGCGTGHYAGALAAAGLEAVGLDLDEAMVEAARRRYRGAQFVATDLTEVRAVVATAQGAFCIGNVLPHLAPAARAQFLRDLAVVLPPGAPWLAQTVNFDRLLPLSAPHDLPPIEAGGGLVFARRYEPGPGASIRFVTALMRADPSKQDQEDSETVFTGETVLWPLASRELAAANAAAGFHLQDQWGGFGGEVFDAAGSGACVQVYRRE
ncbi:MAG: class I SAM-dependent methyltransferase [Candidatus Krumholzibacteria bacterium]|jgi:SAM-dependent methyltransferase|nr:class I SAM-dependent methyltransferase [Candidatus Krumholzibacteria bacterium]